MRLFGKGEVAILDGGLAKWRAENRPLDAGRSPMGDTRFVPHEDRADLRTIDAMRANLEHPAEQVIDARAPTRFRGDERSESHTSEIPSPMRNAYPVFCLKQKKKKN